MAIVHRPKSRIVDELGHRSKLLAGTRPDDHRAYQVRRCRETCVFRPRDEPQRLAKPAAREKYPNGITHALLIQLHHFPHGFGHRLTESAHRDRRTSDEYSHAHTLFASHPNALRTDAVDFGAHRFLVHLRWNLGGLFWRQQARPPYQRMDFYMQNGAPSSVDLLSFQPGWQKL